MGAWLNHLLCALLAAAALAASAAPAWALPVDCVEGKCCKIKVLDAHPTQKYVGMIEARMEADELVALKRKSKKLEKLIKDKPGMAVLGPEGKLYLVDGHHFATALESAGIEEMYVCIGKDWSQRSSDEFWRLMTRKKWTYLWDVNGERIAVDRLPASVRGLLDDPYRSLAWMVKQAGGYKDLGVPFQEFEWARFFRRQGVVIASDRMASYRKAFAEAMPLVRKKIAEDLPGYRGKKVKKRDGCRLRDIFDDLFVDD